MSFTLDSYAIPTSDEVKPDWVKSALTSLLYDNVIKTFFKIQQSIECGENLSIKDRKIVLRRIAKASSVDPSALSERRHPQLIDFIKQKNLQLQELWLASSAEKYRSGRKKKKEEILSDCKAMAVEIQRLTSLSLSEALQAVINSQLTETHRNLVLLIETLKSENQELKERNSALSEQLRQVLKVLNRRDFNAKL